MVNVNDFLNKRFSLRNLSDAQFEQLLPSIAQSIAQVDFVPGFTVTELFTDWKKLKSWQSTELSINSTSRLGMKLCEQYFPNFYDIETSAGLSFRKLWTPENLERILRWNRKSHSTPYLSELRRGVYFCCGMTKNTMYRPQMMKLACTRYQATTVLDPCAGWGGRMLGAVAAGCTYYAFEPNTATYANLIKLADFLNISDRVNIYCDDARNMGQYPIPSVDLVLTSPPYFDLEVYTHESTQSINQTATYTAWCDQFLGPVIKQCLSKLGPNGKSCWNVGRVRNRNMIDDVIRYHNESGYVHDETLSVISSKRQSHQNSSKNAKSSDDTCVFTHVQ